jgi:hypothetical protein
MKSFAFSVSLFFVVVLFSFAHAQKVGDTKYSYAPEDHNGWFKLDGRPLTSLPAEAQQVAAALGYTTTLPNATNRLFKTSNTVPFKALGGANTQNILQANLPNVSFLGTALESGEHQHQQGSESLYNFFGGGGYVGPRGVASGGLAQYIKQNTSLNGKHIHNVSVASGGTGLALNIENAFININSFIYLKPTTQLGNLSEVTA